MSRAIVFFLIIFFLSLSPLRAAQTSLSLAEGTTLTGHFTQGGLVIGKTLSGSQVSFDKQPIRVSPDGHFVIAFNRDEPAKVALKIRTPKGKTLSKQLSIAKRDYNIQRINGLPSAKVSPRKPEVLARIREEIALATQARRLDDARLDFLEPFIWPTKGRISGIYGSQRILNGKPRRPHFGIDIAAPTGTEVLAPASGLITLAHKDMFFSGGTIILDHGHGLSSSFLHLSKLLVKKGDVVKQGDVIALVGATGRVTGPHLDWRMNLFKRRIDPQFLVPAMPEQSPQKQKQKQK